MSKIKLTAIVTGFPPGLRPPTPLPGESMLQIVIRNHPRQWRNCLERFRNDFGASEAVCSRLSQGDVVADLSPVIRKEVERFMNLHLPSHGRTLQGLAEIRDQMMEPEGLAQLWQLELTEIIWPRLKNFSCDAEAQEYAASLGATVVGVGGQEGGPLDIGSLLQDIHGDYLWILPGGNRLSGAMTVVALIRVLRAFQENPKLALYSDQCYCMIYRTSALRALMASGKTLSAELRDNARMLQDVGFQITSDSDPIHGLVEIESLYGGQHDRFSQMPSSRASVSKVGRTSWWRRLLGLK